MANRRSFLQSVLGVGAGLFASEKMTAAVPKTVGAHVPVVTTEVGDLPFTMDGDWKVFHLIAEVLQQEIAPGKTLDLWGFNGSAPGPTIQVFQGDKVRVIFENRLPEASSIHWHGFEDTIANDGQPGISQEPVLPGASFTYEFEIHQEGTYFYHSHMAMQEMVGLLGAFIMHPRKAYEPHCEKDFVVHLQEYAVLPNNTVPDSMKMEFNWLVLNGKSGPATTPLIVRLGDRVRIRFVNMGMDHHPMHLHGHTFHVTGTEGGRIPEAGWWPGNTVLVGVAQSRTVEFVAKNPGDWMLHCHLPHHMMNQMSSIAGKMTRGDGMGMTDGVSKQANDVPGYPQDAFMEGPMMAMDAAVDIPENHGLKAGWSQYMAGMMTFVRVLPPAEYDAVIGKMNAAKRARDPYASILGKIVPVLVAFLMGGMAWGQSMPGMDMSMPMTQHQHMPGMDMSKPAVQTGPRVRDTQALQEPENPTKRTGGSVAAPELLGGLERRPALFLEDFLAMAEKQNPTISQAQTMVKGAAARALQAGLYPNPSVGYQGEQIRGGTYGGGEQGGYVEQEIVMGGKLGLRRDVYRQQGKADAIGVEEQRARVKNDVTRAFYAALVAQAVVEVRKQMAGVALDAVETVHQLANVGQADAPDILQTEVEAEQAKVDFVAAQRRYLEEFAVLAAVSGRQDLGVSRVAGDLEALPEMDAEKMAASIGDSNPMVKRLEQQVGVSEAQLRAAQREVIPNVVVRAGEQYNFEHVTDFPARAAGPQSFASASVTLPVWNRNQGSVAANEAEVERARQEVVRARLALRQKAEPVAQAYLAARFAADRYKTEMLPRAQRAYELYKVKYDAMALPYPQVLHSQLNLLQMQIGYLTTLGDAWQSGVDLQYGVLHGGLEMPR
ncbi:Outer membrane efflux protein [Granulicella pectinivorans]|uniref:Outer membrane efflux protein n=1 Tax=Granulicella pectinivorans TaxID=474950 RepID=A0A1I6MXU0_9BACT|nr:multicopper oxidase domain-containing protein [Granulicella pectinivorans]SFS20510.1 Outer membrane efflux protein [Granulicella pectinivorans]